MASRRRLMTAKQAARMLEEDSSELNGSDRGISLVCLHLIVGCHSVSATVTADSLCQCQ